VAHRFLLGALLVQGELAEVSQRVPSCWPPLSNRETFSFPLICAPA
jgi:hypothetical protein